MKNIFIFLLFIGFSLETNVIRLPKYGSISCNDSDYVYLELSDFGKGDNIYLEVSFYSNIEDYKTLLLYYMELDEIDESYLNSTNFTESKEPYDYSNSTFSNNNYSHKNYYKVELETNSKYLVLKIIINDSDHIIIKHSRKSHTAAIIISICVIIGIVIMAVGIYFYIRRTLSKVKESEITEPLEAAAKAEPIYSPSQGFDPIDNEPYFSTY